MVLERGEDLHEAEAFTGIGRKMVCNPQGTWGKEASPARENAALQSAAKGAGKALLPSSPVQCII